MEPKELAPMIEALTMPAILLALPISGAVNAAQLLRALDLNASVRYVAAIAFALAACAVTFARQGCLKV
jgi:hypothetical protein